MPIGNDILTQVQTDVQGLSLTGIVNENVVIHKVASERDRHMPGLPGIIIAESGAKTIQLTGSNVRDDIEYPVVIITIAPSNQDQDLNRSRNQTWHEAIISKFIHQHLTAVPSVWKCTINPRDVFDRTSFDRNLDVGGVILRFTSRETRG